MEKKAEKRKIYISFEIVIYDGTQVLRGFPGVLIAVRHFVASFLLEINLM